MGGGGGNRGYHLGNVKLELPLKYLKEVPSWYLDECKSLDVRGIQMKE